MTPIDCLIINRRVLVVLLLCERLSAEKLPRRAVRNPFQDLQYLDPRDHDEAIGKSVRQAWMPAIPLRTDQAVIADADDGTDGRPGIVMPHLNGFFNVVERELMTLHKPFGGSGITILPPATVFP